ncbi:VOC family protein [Candidatus Leptofilum sp.]|uniref:VOC family protein n=1 Tax=Candidatus Leptofilum sp. TaxID=3241576 RepID=UPI003B5B3780
MKAIHPRTQIGLVSLKVADLGRSLPFYTHNIGLKLLQQEGNTAVLGTTERPLLELIEQPGATPPGGTTGLYHFALLVPSRLELARVFKNLVETRTRFQGFSDHSVSEAIYLGDLDGNGIEIYRDRQREAWPMQNGRLQMGTLPLDLESLAGELNGRPEPWTGIHPNTVMGHIHLHVRDLDEAEDFYCNSLGFERVMRYGASAGFVSAGGYHHHIGLNTWAGRGVPASSPEAVGLRHYQILLPDQPALDAVTERMAKSGIAHKTEAKSFIVGDPSQNEIVLKVATS